jgi:hypothetical protein
LPAAERDLSETDWNELDRAFAENRDPLTWQGVRRTRPTSACLRKSCSSAPAPIGVGEDA